MLQSYQPSIHCSLPSLPFNLSHFLHFLINSPLLVGSMASPSLLNFSTQHGRRMLSEFLQEPQEPFLFEMRKLSNQGGIRNGRAAAFLKRVLAKLAYGKTSRADNRKSSVFSCFSDYSNDHQLSPVSVLELQYSDESSPSLDDHSMFLLSFLSFWVLPIIFLINLIVGLIFIFHKNNVFLVCTWKNWSSSSDCK